MCIRPRNILFSALKLLNEKKNVTSILSDPIYIYDKYNMVIIIETREDPDDRISWLMNCYSQVDPIINYL